MDKTLLIENACTELMAYGVPDRKMQLKRFVKKYMLGRKAAPKDMIFWPTGLLAEGLWHCRTELALQCGKGWKKESFDVELAQGQVRQIESVLEAYFDRWRKKGMPLYFLDDLVAGETFLEQYLSRSADKEQASWQQDTRTRQYREAVDKMASFAMEYAKDETGSLLYRAKQRNGCVLSRNICV